jgi:hypothetical protein
MLNVRPETARKILDFSLSATQIFAGVALCGFLIVCLISLLTGGTTDFNQYYSIPVNLEIYLQNGQALGITELKVPIKIDSLWKEGAVAVLILVFLSLLIHSVGYIRKTMNQIMEDPFHIRVIIKLRRISFFLLCAGIMQIAFSVVIFFIGLRVNPEQIIKSTFENLATIKTVTNTERFYPAFSFSFLWAALALILLAAVFQRGHDLREQERQLRLDQELTV